MLSLRRKIHGEGNIFSSQCSFAADIYFAWPDISLLNGRISTKLPQIFVIWVEIAWKVLKVQGHRSRSQRDEMHLSHCLFYSPPVWRIRGFEELLQGSGVRSEGEARRSWKLFAAQVPDFCPIRSLHAKLITSETTIKLRHVFSANSGSRCHTFFFIRADTSYILSD